MFLFQDGPGPYHPDQFYHGSIRTDDVCKLVSKWKKECIAIYPKDGDQKFEFENVDIRNRKDVALDGIKKALDAGDIDKEQKDIQIKAILKDVMVGRFMSLHLLHDVMLGMEFNKIAPFNEKDYEGARMSYANQFLQTYTTFQWSTTFRYLEFHLNDPFRKETLPAYTFDSSVRVGGSDLNSASCKLSHIVVGLFCPDGPVLGAKVKDATTSLHYGGFLEPAVNNREYSPLTGKEFRKQLSEKGSTIDSDKVNLTLDVFVYGKESRKQGSQNDETTLLYDAISSVTKCESPIICARNITMEDVEKAWNLLVCVHDSVLCHFRTPVKGLTPYFSPVR